MNYDLVINNGQVIVSKKGQLFSQNLHIGVTNGKIASLSSSPLSGQLTIDARHLHVLPGVIDSQVHFREPGLTHKEDLETGTRAAALGGVTSIFEMPNTKPPTTTREALEDKIKRAEGRAWVNFAFFVGAAQDNISSLRELEKSPGCSGVKVFMGSSTGSLLVEDDENLRQILRSGQRRVIVHSEDEYRLRERKHIADSAKSPLAHPEWRDAESAVRSTERLLRLARETHRPVHVLHVTTKEEIAILKEYKDIATVEVTPQHLTLFAPDCYETLGTLAQMNPPIRSKDHMEGLWKGLLDGTVDIIGSDHAPHTIEEKTKEYPQSPSGMPGVQTLVPIMLNHIHEGRLSLTKFVELVCENPRRVFGCTTKGQIEVGLDADFTLVDLKKQRRIENSWIVSRCGWTPFDGKHVTGWPTHTIVGGHLVMQDDHIIGTPQGQKVLFE
ncbi:MAG: dihydroorotase [Oligoflexia bacterium]|nr:MAG: dihydroorotase [Oligoflexia bacterium]